MRDLFRRRDLLRALGAATAPAAVRDHSPLSEALHGDDEDGPDSAPAPVRRRLQAAEDGPLGVLWERDVGTSRSLPRYVDGQVVVGTREGLLVLDADSGEQTALLEAGPLSGAKPVADGRVVYAAVDQGQTSEVVSLRPSTGSVQSLLRTEYVDSRNTGVPYGMTLSGDTLFVPANAAGVYAVSTASREVEWQYAPGSTDSPYLNSRPGVSADTVFVSSSMNGILYAIDRAAGVLQWRANVNAETFQPLVVDDAVVVATADRVLALDGASGDEVWSRDIAYGARYDSSGAYDGDRVYVTGRDDSKALFALDPADGATVWRTDGVGGRVDLVEGRLYAADSRSGLTVLNPEDGEKLQSFASAAVVSVRDGRIFATDSRAEVVRALEPGPSPEFSISPVEPTVGEAVQFTAADRGDGYTYAWFAGEQQFADGPEATYTFESSYGPDVRLRVTDADGVTATNRREIPVEPASSSGLDASTVAAGGVVGTTLLGGAAWLYRRRGGDEGADSGDGEDGVANLGVDGFQTTAADALDAAASAREEGAFHEAIAELDDAVEACENALAELSADDDRREDVEATLATARRRREAVEARREATADFRETLSTAETRFQAAVAAHARGNSTVAQLRYRQARDGFDAALDVLADADADLLGDDVTVGFDAPADSPPADLEAFPQLPDAARAALADRGVETHADLADLDDADFEALGAAEALDAATAARVRALANWRDADVASFDGRAAVERRRDLADDGYHATQ